MHLRDFQQHQPWTADQRAQYEPEHRTDAMQVAHTILHAVKAAGKLVELEERSAHTGGTPVAAATAKPYVADLCIIAARLANLLAFDLEDAVVQRIQEQAPDWDPIMSIA